MNPKKYSTIRFIYISCFCKLSDTKFSPLPRIPIRPCTRVLLEKLVVSHLVNKLPCFKQPATDTSSEPDESSLHPSDLPIQESFVNNNQLLCYCIIHPRLSSQGKGLKGRNARNSLMLTVLVVSLTFSMWPDVSLEWAMISFCTRVSSLHNLTRNNTTESFH